MNGTTRFSLSGMVYELKKMFHTLFTPCTYIIKLPDLFLSHTEKILSLYYIYRENIVIENKC